MHHNLPEKFPQRQGQRVTEILPDTDAKSSVHVNRAIRDYFDESAKASDQTSWVGKSEIPTAKEIIGEAREIVLQENKMFGAWETRADYLQTQYELLREDAVSPLREVVEELKNKPGLMEVDSRESAAIYENVYITGLTFANNGIAIRVSFSLRRIQKKVRWIQSKRLRTGSIVALTPADDMFKSLCRVAVVAARPLEGLQQIPPCIDLFFSSAKEIELDPQREWVMVEAKEAYFESYRHTLLALQKMTFERFPLAEHLVKIEKDIQSPAYTENQPCMDLSHALALEETDYCNIDVLSDWPEHHGTGLDQSQSEALRRILTKRLAIVQGPPGTGKTHTSVTALQVLVGSTKTTDPPIVIAAQTNHALDQLLRLVSLFEPGFIRIGSRTTDNVIIKPRTLYEVREGSSRPNVAVGGRMHIKRQKKEITKFLNSLLNPVKEGKEPLPFDFFLRLNLITNEQYESLERGAADWVSNDKFKKGQGITPWLGKSLVLKKPRISPQDYGLEYEEVDPEFEQLDEVEAESGPIGDGKFEVLRGVWCPLNDHFTGRKKSGTNDERIKKLLECEDLWQIPEVYRGSVYDYLHRKALEDLTETFRSKAVDYDRIARELKINKWEVDAAYLRDTRVIGMTLTGLSKNRGLIASLKPRVVLIEEAAESLEAHVTAACFDSLEHLILVGDHQQLQGHCSVKDLEGPPFYLNVSMFQRLVQNDMAFSRLKQQRRMIPEIRQLLTPIYEDLTDHPCVLDREPINGMGNVNMFFFSHEWPESNDNAASKYNKSEADMIVGLVDYLLLNGTAARDVTVLTFYNGQRKAILSGLRIHPNLTGLDFNVATVDSYQGEENEIVILSLVRNNVRGNIGFLSAENRVCVSLSRARRGFYVFGHGGMLLNASPLWKKVIRVFTDPPRIGVTFPLTCTRHNQVTELQDPSEWDELMGGCQERCVDTLPCGHACTSTCHPYEHDMVICHNRCIRKLECGHVCEALCFVEPCVCPCTTSGLTVTAKSAWETPLPSQHSPTYQAHDMRKGTHLITDSRSTSLSNSISSNGGQRSSSMNASQAYVAYANGGYQDSDAALHAVAVEAAAEMAQRRLDEEMEQALFGDGTATATDNEPVPTPHFEGNGHRAVYTELFKSTLPYENAVSNPQRSLLDM